MAEITFYVDPDAVGLGNGSSWADAYTTLNGALTAEATDLVSSGDNYTFLCRSLSGTADTTAVSLSNSWETDATHFITIKAASGYEALKIGWSTSRYRLSVTDGVAFIDDSFDNLKIEVIGLQIERVYSSATYASTFRVTGVATGSSYTLKNCRIRTNNNTLALLRVNDADADVTCINCIFEGTNRYGAQLQAGTVKLYNCIIKDAATDGVLISSGVTATIKNSALFDNADDIDDSASSTIDYCASDDGDGTNPISPSGSSWSNEFNNPSSGDYTLLTGGNCYQGGNPISGVTEDIEGNPYNETTPSVGVDEYYTAPSGIVLFRRRIEGE